MADDHYDALLLELECPICTNYMSPPIRQCATGHSVCEPCRKRLPKCALCQGKFTESRNLSLEGLAVKMRYPCINKGAGCDAKLSYTEREVHELRCNLKGYKCGMERCPWVGKLEELSDHWASKKMSSKPYNKSNICHTKLKTESYYVNMVNAYNKLFWFKCKLTKNKIYWAVQYIGQAAESETFYYEIEIFKPGLSKKKVLMSDYCQSVELENSQLFTDEACISISADSVMKFLGVDQLLLYYMKVYPVGEEKSGGAQANSHRPPVANKAEPRAEHKFKKQRDRSKGPHSAQKGPATKNLDSKKPHQKDGFVLL